MGEAGRRIVESEYPLELHLTRHLEVYDSLVASGRAERN
jgi:hypothetical protein